MVCASSAGAVCMLAAGVVAGLKVHVDPTEARRFRLAVAFQVCSEPSVVVTF